MAAKDLIFTILGVDKASPVLRKVGKELDRLGDQATRSMAGMAASAVASGAAVASAGAATAVALAGIGAVALRESTAVRGAFEGLSETVRTGLIADAAPLEEAFVGAANQIGSSFQRMRPQLREAFEESAPHVATLTSGVLDFTENALSGMVSMVRSAGPVMGGWRSALHDSGEGAREFFEILATGSEDAGQGFEHVGQLVRGLLPEIGESLVAMSGLWAEHGDQVSSVVIRLVDVLGELSGGALPVMSEALGVALNVLDGALTVIGPLADQIGPLIGLWLSLATAMRAMRAVQGIVDGVSLSVSRFNTGMQAAGKQGVGGFATGVGRAMNLVGGPWGLALAAGSAALAIFGAESQESAAAQRSLTSALEESGGAFDETARKALAASDQYKAISGDVDAAGLSHREYIDALIAGGPALDALKSRLEALKHAGETVNTESGEMVVSYTAQGEAANNLLRETDGLRETVAGSVTEFEQQQRASEGATGALQQAIPGTDALREAIKTLGNDTADTKSHVDALNTAWRQLFGIGISLEEAVAGFEEGLDQLRAQLDEVRSGTSDWQSSLFAASGQINLTTEAGRELHAQLVEQGEQYRTLAQTAYDTALQQGMSQQQATAVALDASRQRRDQFLLEAQQMGFNSEQARILADRYFGLPDDVMTLIKADAAGAQGVIDNLVRRNNGRSINMHVNMSVREQRDLGLIHGSVGGRKDGGLVGHFAQGGHVRGFPHGGPVIGAGGPRDDLIPAMLSNGEFVINAAATRKHSALLSAINDGRTVTPQLATAGRAPTPPTVLEIRSGGTRMDDLLVEVLRRSIRERGGDVQVVLGR